jgi:hypothetical protein
LKIIVVALLVLLVLSFGLTIWDLFWPDATSELISLTVGLPIIILNIWAWQAPELLRKLIFGKKKIQNDDWSV